MFLVMMMTLAYDENDTDDGSGGGGGNDEYRNIMIAVVTALSLFFLEKKINYKCFRCDSFHHHNFNRRCFF